MRITQALHRALQQTPDAVMTVFAGRETTVAGTADRVARLAAALTAHGVNTGDRVGVLALNSDRYHEILLAVPWAGAVVNPVNVRWSPKEVAHSLVDCDTDVLFVDDTFAPMVQQLTRLAPNLRLVIHCGESETPEGLLGYEQLVSDHAPAADVGGDGSELFGIFYTGGTTGHPKGVMLTHDNLVASAMGTLVTTDVFSRGGRLMHVAPMFHLADLAAWSIGLMTGATHLMVPSFTPAGVLDAISRQGATDAVLVPTMIQMLLDAPEAAEADLGTMRGVLYGASPISESLLRRARERMPNAKFTQAYGMTELSPITTLLTSQDHDDPALARSAGRAAAHAEVKVVDHDGNEVPRGETGEVVARGDHVMRGYWGKPAETAEALRDGWMHTGDAGVMDDDGYLFIVDRIKDMIITGDENVYSVEVENALAKHPAVAQSAVIGVPDDRWGERVHAVIVLRDGADVDGEALKQFCLEHIANYKVPRSFAFVDALPVSAAGKILKRDLRAQTWQ